MLKSSFFQGGYLALCLGVFPGYTLFVLCFISMSKHHFLVTSDNFMKKPAIIAGCCPLSGEMLRVNENLCFLRRITEYMVYLAFSFLLKFPTFKMPDNILIIALYLG